MKWEPVKAYFSFTRKERTGVITLLAIIFLLFIFPAVFGKYLISDEPPKIELLDEELAKLRATIPQDSAGQNPDQENDREKISAIHPEAATDAQKKPLHLFAFDPNTLPEQEWLKLGINAKTLKTLIHYRERGGKFRVAEDLQKVYGFSEADYQRLLLYIRISPPLQKYPEQKSPLTQETKKDSVSPVVSLSGYQRKTFHAININRADTAEWAKLPGIGQKLAARIVNFRERLGGFFSTEQVGETFGLPDSTFQKLKPWLEIEKNPVLRKILINTADVETLKNHPYIRWQLANTIINYRKEHGNFISPDDLGKLALAPEGWVKKIGPYVEIGTNR